VHAQRHRRYNNEPEDWPTSSDESQLVLNLQDESFALFCTHRLDARRQLLSWEEGRKSVGGYTTTDCLLEIADLYPERRCWGVAELLACLLSENWMDG
jgi:hypothetical protein